MRVLVDLISPEGNETGPRPEGYAEPDYEDIGRARILHVFRERGGEVEVAETPFDRDDAPAPAPLVPMGPGGSGGQPGDWGGPIPDAWPPSW